MPVTNTLTSSSIRKFLPNKVISGYPNSIDNLSSWLYDDGMGDPWWQGAAGAPYQWILNASVNTVLHSSHLTRVPMQYTGLDITPGMWVMGSSNRAVKIISVQSATDSSIVCVVEDVDRYNTFSDNTQTGSGIFSQYENLLFFELGDDGLPVLNPVPDGTEAIVVTQIEDRFRVFNPSVEEQFFQLNHGFLEGQILKLDPISGLFEQATSSDIYIAGTVTTIGPGPNYFYLAPSTKIINDLEPGLPGTVGDTIYLDPTSGNLTTNGGLAIYIQMSDPVASFTVGSVENPVTYPGTVLKLNNTLVSFDGTDVLTASDIITVINALTPNHGVVASMGSQPTTIIGSTAFSTTTPATGSMVFSVNGIEITVTQPSIVYGTSGQLGWWDIVRSVNELTFKHGVVASSSNSTGLTTFTNTSGGPINFVNITPATTDGPDMSFTDMMGLTADNPSGSADYLQFTRPDGGEIILSDNTGTFTTDTGILSADNGVLPLALIVDKTMNASGSYMVSTIADRDALTNVRVGDQVYVQTDTNGKWSMYLYTAGGWVLIADEAAANTDANTLEAVITPSSAASQLMGTVSLDSRIINITVEVTAPFTADAVLTVGTDSVPDAILAASNIDLTNIGTYTIDSAFVYDNTQPNFNVDLYFSKGSATSGSATVMVSYL